MSSLNNLLKRIVVIGSAGVGKTTIIKAIQPRINLKIIHEQARVVCKKLGYKNIYEIKNPNTFRLVTLDCQIKAEEELKQFISDRSTIDCWVHWIRWSWNTAKTYETETYYKKTFQQALKYSHIIYVPRLIKPKEDGFRWNNEDYQNQVDRLFLNVLYEWDLMKRTYIIQTKTVKERTEEVMGFLIPN